MTNAVYFLAGVIFGGAVVAMVAAQKYNAMKQRAMVAIERICAGPAGDVPQGWE